MGMGVGVGVAISTAVGIGVGREHAGSMKARSARMRSRVIRNGRASRSVGCGSVAAHDGSAGSP